MTLFFYSFEIISVVMPDPKFFFWITAFVADAVAVNPNGIKALLANGFNTFFIKGKPVFTNAPERLPKNCGTYFRLIFVLINCSLKSWFWLFK